MINHPINFNNSVAKDFDGVFEWDYLEGVFPRGIMPMDWDGVVELEGNFLVFETKDVGIEVPQGQLMALTRATKLAPITVIVIWGKKECNECQIISKGIQREKKVSTNDDIRNICIKWVEFAQNNSNLAKGNLDNV